MKSLSTLNKELAANFWIFPNFSSRTTSEPPKPQLFSRTTFELYGLDQDQLATLLEICTYARLPITSKINIQHELSKTHLYAPQPINMYPEMEQNQISFIAYVRGIRIFLTTRLWYSNIKIIIPRKESSLCAVSVNDCVVGVTVLKRLKRFCSKLILTSPLTGGNRSI